MLSSDMPAIVVVHGAYSTASSFSDFSTNVEKAGFRVSCLQLPSCNRTKSEATFPNDVATVRRAVASLVNIKHPVLLVMHSYGRIVGASAVLPSLCLSER